MEIILGCNSYEFTLASLALASAIIASYLAVLMMYRVWKNHFEHKLFRPLLASLSIIMVSLIVTSIVLVHVIISGILAYGVTLAVLIMFIGLLALMSSMKAIQSGMVKQEKRKE